MIAALICLIVILVLIAVFIGKNLSNACAIWFFKSFGETNIVIIVFIAFAAGIITALLFLLVGKCMKKAKSTNKDKPEVEKVPAVKEKKQFKLKKSSKSEEKKENIEKKSESEEIKSEKTEENTENIDKTKN